MRWRLSGDLTVSRSEQKYRGYHAFDDAGESLAVQTGFTGSNVPFDVFKDSHAGSSLDFSQFVLPDVAEAIEPSRTTTKNFALRLSGPLPWELPGGAPIVSALLEHRQDDLGEIRYEFSPKFFLGTPSLAQKVNSAYVELLIPVLPAGTNTSMERLELQVAGRVDTYRTAGASPYVEFDGVRLAESVSAENKTKSIDPTVAVRFHPVNDVTLRASFGTGFLPPSPVQLSAQTIPDFDYSSVADPLRGNEPLLGVNVLSGGNANIRPEESSSRSAGVILQPRILPGLRMSVDWTRINKRDGIANIGTPDGTNQGLLDAYLSLAPERIVRGPPSDGFPVGPILAWDQTLINISSQRVEAWDFGIDYASQFVTLGKFTFQLNATHISHNESQVTPIDSIEERAGTLGALKWRAHAVASWEYKSWTTSWGLRWFDRYFVNTLHTVLPEQGSSTVPSQTYQDARIIYRMVNGQYPKFMNGLEFQFAALNVFKQVPPVDVQYTNYYSPFGDPRLRSWTFTVKKIF